MIQEDKQSAVQRLASTMQRVSVEAIRKNVEDTMVVRPSGLGIKSVPLKDRLQQCDRAEAAEFRTAMRLYIDKWLNTSYEEKTAARTRLERASRCLILDDLSNATEPEIAGYQEIIVDRIQDSLFASEYSARVTPQRKSR